jgi:hypothetical protein
MLKKRSLIVGLALLGAILIAGTGFVGCQKPSMFCGGGFHGKEFPKHVLEKIDSEVEALDLTETQLARYEEIRSLQGTSLLIDHLRSPERYTSLGETLTPPFSFLPR